MIAGMFWAFMLRAVQAAAECSPFLLAGLIVAAVFRAFMGPRNVQMLFGSNTWRALPQAWALGMLLPVCSIGVLPAIREMRRAGISGGTILAFALAAPLFNPLSLLYGLTLSKPFVILAFAFCSLLMVTAIGIVWDRLFPNTSLPSAEEPKVPYGWRRVTYAVLAIFRESASASMIYTAIALMGTGLLGALIPHTMLQTAMNHDRLDAPLTMAWVSIPAYATPMTAMSQIGSIFQHGNSAGAAFVLLALGTGMNLGLIAWMCREYGIRPALTWLSVTITIALIIAYAVNGPLQPRDIDPADHTHAFDMYAYPFHNGEAHPMQTAAEKFREGLQPHTSVGLWTCGVLILLGAVVQIADPQRRLDAWLEKPTDIVPLSGDLVVSTPVLGLVMLIGLVVFSIVGCYAFYPPYETAIAELRAINAEAITSAKTGHYKAAVHWIAIEDDLTRRLQVGVYLRSWKLSDYQQIKARILRDKLELLEHECEHEDAEEIRKLCTQVLLAYDRLRVAYRP